MKPWRSYAAVFILLTALFFLRVAAQALAAIIQPAFLPSMAEWTTPSGSPFATPMALRYVVTMRLYPERRWLGHTVPILLHFVLAGFLFALGRFHAGRRPLL